MRDDRSFSLTVYGTDDQMLIPNERGAYDRTSHTSKLEPDGTAVITLSPDGGGRNGIPTGKPFYGILRAYQPLPGVPLKASVRKH